MPFKPFTARHAIHTYLAILSVVPPEEWARTWVNMRMEFFRRFQDGRLFPNFGIDFFEIVAKHLDTGKPYHSQLDCNGYDANFNAWLIQETQ